MADVASSGARSAALVTGASSGIGMELARCFARDAHDLVLIARDQKRLDELASELRGQHGIRAEVIAADLSKSESPAAIYDRTSALGIEVEFLVNNAGFGVHGLFWEANEKNSMNLLAVNIVALTHLTRLFLPDMVRQGRGRVLNVASIAAYPPGPYLSTYYASKAYVLSFTEALDAELAGTGVGATALCPGPVATEFQQRAGLRNSALFRFGQMDAPTVAKIGYRGMMKGRRVVIPGLMTQFMALAARHAPRRLQTNIAARLNRDRA